MKRPYQLHLFLVFLIVLLIQSQCSSSSGSGTIDGIELGAGLWLNLEDIEREADFVPEVGSKLHSHFAALPSEIDSIRVYSATTEIAEEKMKIRVILFPLAKGNYAGSFLAITVLGDGSVERVRIWGNEFVNADRDAAIENFYRQFSTRRALLKKDEMFSTEELESYLSSLDVKTRYMYRHPILMFGNSFLIRRTMALTGQNIVPDVAWYEDGDKEFQQMITNASLLEDLMDSKAITQYKAEAVESSEELRKIIREVRAGGDAGKIRSLIKDFRSTSCTGCHDVKANSGTDLTIYRRKYELGNHGFRDGIYKVGFDVWTMPDDPESSRYLADVVKAGVYYLSYLDL